MTQREVRLGPVRIILLAEIFRIAQRIFSCIHIRHFIPLAKMKSKFSLLAPAKRVHFSHTAQQPNTIGCFPLFICKKKHCFN